MRRRLVYLDTGEIVMTVNNFSVSLLCAFAACAAGPASAGTSLVKIIDTSFVAPDGKTISAFSQPQASGSTIVFMGATATPNTYLFSVPVTGGKPVLLASTLSKVPSGMGHFTPSGHGPFTAFEPPTCSPPGVGKTSAVFVGRDAGGNEGLYSVPLKGGHIVPMISHKTPIPGGPVGTATTFGPGYPICNISVSSELLVFDAGLAGVYAIKTDGSKLKRIADPNTPTSGSGASTKYLQPGLSVQTATYVGATTGGPAAIFSGAADALGKPISDAVAGTYDMFAYPFVSASRIVYAAGLADNGAGLFSVATTGGKPTMLMDLSTKPPAGTPGTSFSQIGTPDGYLGWSLYGAVTMFAASTTDGTTTYPGLFATCNGKLEKLLVTGQTLNGEVITSVGGISSLAASTSVGVTTTYGATLVGGAGGYGAIYLVKQSGAC
jgi:hypothetical protein